MTRGKWEQDTADRIAPWGARPARGWAAALAALFAGASAQADWPTCRGSAQRTGCLDDQAGPKAPSIQWAHKAQENYVAAPLPEGSAVYFPALGPFNTGLFHCLAAQDGLPRLLWSKAAPFLKRPVVCAPVISEGLVIFGDGMHQTDDAVLYCLMADTGRPVWQYPVPGHLVHLEASPTVERGRVYTGGGDAGVLCLELKRVILDGQEMDLSASQALVERRWKELTAVKEGGKELPYTGTPHEEALPKPVPKLVWRAGKNAWHVDAPVTVAGDSVLVSSAFLDEERKGKRALLCLRAADGATVWETPLEVNPWAGATVAGNLALVGCSSIRFDLDLIRNATGRVVAVELASGRVAWSKPVPGGILSPIAVRDGLAVFAATDGKLRAWRTDSGAEQWQYDARQPFFAGPAVAAGVAYGADLAGVLHAVTLADGRAEWTFDVANAAGAQLPGMVYGSPVLHRGRIYLATCNVQGPHVGQPCMVVCVADKQAPGRADALTVDATRRTVSIPCRIAPRKLPTLADIYPLEVIACFPAPLGQKAHETVVATEVKPSDLHAALVGLGLRPGAPIRGGTSTPPTGPEVRVLLEVPDLTGRSRVIPIEDALIDARTGRGMLPLRWHFTGSTRREPAADPAKRVYAADLGGTLITLFPVTDETVIQSSLSMQPRAILRLDTDKARLPPEGTAARLIIAADGGQPPVELAPLLSRYSHFAPPPPRYTLPRPPDLAALVAMPLRWPLPEAGLRVSAHDLPAERTAIRSSPMPEPPMEILSSATPWPAVPDLPAGVRARAAAPDPRRPPSLPPVGWADPERRGVEVGPGEDPLRPFTLAKPTELRQAPLPFVRLPIPEPSASPAAVRLDAPASDLDAPVRSAVPQGKVDLPVKK